MKAERLAESAELRARGFEPVADEPLEGFDQLYASGPFGNSIEFMEPATPPAGAPRQIPA